MILVPAYEPDHRLLDLLRCFPEGDMLVVDDGSGPDYAPVFAQARALGAEVVAHERNRGKGAALRTGFAWIRANRPGEDVVCADSDGQHTPADILRTALALHSGPGAEPDMVLGVRHFTGPVPLRSRVGNAATAWLFAAFTHLPIVDTQTGLRAYPARLLPWLLAVEGDRFDYELRLLLAAAREGLVVAQVSIDTVYLEENVSSHFRPVVDSVRVYRPFLAYGASSLAGFAVDVVLLVAVLAVTHSLVLAVVGARLVSSVLNFTLNRTLVFADGGRAPLWPSAARYAALAAALLAANLALMSAGVGLGLPVLAAKIGTEALLFLAGFAVQKVAVFTRPASADRLPARARTPA